MREVTVSLEHGCDRVRIAQVQPVPGWRAQNEGVAHLLVTLPPEGDFESQVVVFGDVVIAKAEREPSHQRHKPLVHHVPERVDVINGYDSHWHADLARRNIIPNQTYRGIKCESRDDQGDHRGSG